MSWFSNLFAGNISDIVKETKNIVDEFHFSGEEKAELNLKLEDLAQDKFNTLQDNLKLELESKQKIILAELNQGDNFTKRARPTVVYMGLVMILFNYCIAPLISEQPFELPAEFWIAWGGIVSTWTVGRSFEKAGKGNKASNLVTGSKSLFG